jgi:hypothetical protein
VQLYVPLLLPLGLEFGGFIFLAFGFAPRRREIPKSDEKIAEILQPTSASPIEQHAVAMQVIAKAANMPAKAGTKAYYMQRLQKDHPALAARIASGEISVYAASIAAGLRKAPAKAAKWTTVDSYMPKVDA